MTNPSREHDSRERGLEATTEAPVGPPPEPGSQASRAKTKSGTAGDASQDAPRQFTAEEVFAILGDAVAALEAAGKVPLAAGVSARMRLIEPSFAVARTEFSSFRDVTRAAEAAGIIEAARGNNDFVLSLVSPIPNARFKGETLRPDLWRAIQDWTEGIDYAFDRDSRHTEPVNETTSAHSVPVPKADRASVITWMREFSSHQRGELVEQLNAALAEADPAAGFHRVVRESDGLKRRWIRFLRKRVLETAVAWAMENSIPRADIFLPTPPTEQVAPPVSVAPIEPAEEAALRRQILAILESMPLHELLRLPVPLEYTLTR